MIIRVETLVGVMPGSDELRTAWSLSTLKDGLSFMDGQPHQELLSLKSMSEEAMQRELDVSWLIEP